ncbi:MAG TPA: HAMP domain-containing sensor histidine kinase, partial [Methanomassiliicoccaceae archaeon]|nr:HAMP domain-containing sensor histidine kinase [Methanomassiliicoccaceae archaeon]
AELYIDLLSHDISNMNAAIRGYLELALEKMDIEEKNKQYFTKPISIIETSNRLIENVRKIQQVEGQEAKHGLIDLGWLLEDVRAEAEKYPGREVKINYKTTIKKFVVASELLRDVFDNIISNAIKHSTGPVEISISLSKMFENGREYYKVSIEDNGPGISDELKSKLFQRKQRGRSKTAGSGLGLFLVKKLVEDFHGLVWVEDRVPGDHTQGAKFVVMLPAVSVDGRGQVAL